MLNKYLLLASLLAMAAFGCSASSESPAGGGIDGSTAPPADGGIDGATTPGDGGCSPQSITGFTPRPFMPAALHQGVCSSAQVTTYVTACGLLATPTSCGAWLNANLDPDAGATCGNCIYPALPDGGGINSGANYEDPSNQIAWPNYGACLSAEDAAHGTACGTALDALYDCEAFACENACVNDNKDLFACESLANTTVCATYFAAQATACAYDPIYANGGVGECYAGGADNQDPALSYITTLVCGNVDALPDAGAPDTGIGFDAGSACQGPGSQYPFPSCFTASCATQIAACEQDCACQITLADCFANLFEAQTCVGLIAQGGAGVAATASACIYPMLVDYPNNCH